MIIKRMEKESPDNKKTGVTTKEIRRSALIVTTLSAFLTPLTLSAVNVALPTIGKQLRMSAVSVSWLASVYLLTAVMFLVPFGRMADIYGRKRVFLVGIGIFTVSSFLLGMAPNATLLIVFRALQGVGGAMLFGTIIAILSSAYPPGERGKALGINVAAVYLGLSFGPFVGGLLTYYLGWRSVFLLNVPMGIFIAAVTLMWLKEDWSPAKGEPFDYIGSAIYGLALLFIIYGFSILPGKEGILLLLAGIVGIAVFVWKEANTRNPILDIRVFRTNKAFTLSNLAAFINYSATFAITFLLSFYLQNIRAFSPRTTGLILVAQPIVQAAFSPMAGKLSDRIEPRVMASTGMSLTAAGLFFLALVGTHTPIVLVVGSLCVLGFGFALFSSPNSNAIMGSVEQRHYGIASSMLATMRLLGQVFSMSIAMLIFAFYMGDVELQPENYPFLLKSIKVAFLIFGVICAAGIFPSLTRGKIRE